MDKWFSKKREHKYIIKPAEVKRLKLDRLQLLKHAQAQYHKPYVLRSWMCQEVYNKDPKDLDCSSFILWCYFQQGFKLPRTSSMQYPYCTLIDAKNLNLGDLFFLENKGKICHVGMYIGAGMCLEAAGGRAGRVIRSVAEQNESKPGFVGWHKVPLDKAEDDFFKWVAEHPMGKCKKDDILL